MKFHVPETFGVAELEGEHAFSEGEESPSCSVLSPTAAPYYPSVYYETYDFAIYNDGVPCMTLPTGVDVNNLVHDITDDAFDYDNCFPMDAYDAAEIEACEEFVVEMANLSLLEDREERARQSFNHIRKRWEVRRQSGPKGRPRPPMNLIIPIDHHNAKTHQATADHHRYHPVVTSLVPYSQAHRAMDEKMRAKESVLSMNRVQPRNTKASTKPRHPIHQPRKDS